MKRTGLRLPDALYEALRLRAFRERISMNQLITALLERQIQQPPK